MLNNRLNMSNYILGSPCPSSQHNCSISCSLPLDASSETSSSCRCCRKVRCIKNFYWKILLSLGLPPACKQTFFCWDRDIQLKRMWRPTKEQIEQLLEMKEKDFIVEQARRQCINPKKWMQVYVFMGFHEIFFVEFLIVFSQVVTRVRRGAQILDPYCVLQFDPKIDSEGELCKQQGFLHT